MALIRPPITGDPQLDSWTDQITNQLNQGFLPGGSGFTGGGGGGSGLPGMDGRDGADGNTALYLYQRTTAETPVPTRPTSVTYNLDNADPISLANNGWSGDLPTTGGDYLWVTFRYIASSPGSRAGNITDQSSWDTPVLLGVPGEDAVAPRIDILRLPSGRTTAQVVADYDGTPTLDTSTFRSSSSGGQFRDNMGEAKVLLATVQVGGVDATDAAHTGFTYSWARNGQTFTPSITGQNLTRRFIVIDAGDVNDGGEDVFTCQVVQS